MKGANMKQIFIKYEYIKEKNFSPQAFAALTGLLLNTRNFSMANEWNCTTPFIIAGVLVGKNPTESEVQSISNGFHDLSHLKIAARYKDYYTVDYSKIERVDGKYACLEESEVRAIMNYDGNGNRYSLLKYFACLKSTFNFKTKIGTSTLSFLSKESGKTSQTIDRYHKILEKIGILKVFRFRSTIGSDGYLKRQSNVYCSPENEETALLYIQEAGKMSKLIINDQPDSSDSDHHPINSAFSDQPGV